MYNNFFNLETREAEFHLDECFESYDKFYSALYEHEYNICNVDFEGRYAGWIFIPEKYYVKFYPNGICNGSYHEISCSEFFHDFWFLNPEYDDDQGVLNYLVKGV